MKNALLFMLGVILTIGLQGQNLPEVFSGIPFTIKDGHSGPEVANKFRAMNDAMETHGSGVGVWLSYGDRGERKDKMSWGFTFEFKAVRDYYFPDSDGSENDYPKFNALLTEIAEEGVSTTMDEIEAESGYTDWVCVGFDALIHPKIGEVVGVRSMMPLADKEDALETYLTETLYPAYAEHMPGVNLYVYKGDRGEGKGAYIALWSFESVALRNSYFPSPDSDPTEQFTTDYAPLVPLMNGMNEFMDPNQSDSTYTDYVRIVPFPGHH